MGLRDWVQRNLMGEAMANRKHMQDLYSDPDWMLQAGLGDIEFEQDMYDDIVYGEPAIDETTPGPAGATIKMRFPEEWSNKLKAIPDAPYDELALMGLRKHAMEGGPTRYLDFSPFDVGDLEHEWDDESRYQGVYNSSWLLPGGGELGPNIDINPNYLLNKFDPNISQDKISDIYRHEYKHGIIPPWQPYAHAAIYGTGAKYGLSQEDVGESLYRFSEGPETYGEDYWGRPIPLGGHSRAAGMTHPYTSMPSDPAGTPPRSPQDRAGDVARFFIGGGPQRREDEERIPRPRERRTHHFNTGGLASLML